MPEGINGEIKSLKDKVMKLGAFVLRMRSNTRMAHLRNFVKDTSSLFQLRAHQGRAKNASLAAMLDCFI